MFINSRVFALLSIMAMTASAANLRNLAEEAKPKTKGPKGADATAATVPPKHTDAEIAADQEAMANAETPLEDAAPKAPVDCTAEPELPEQLMKNKRCAAAINGFTQADNPTNKTMDTFLKKICVSDCVDGFNTFMDDVRSFSLQCSGPQKPANRMLYVNISNQLDAILNLAAKAEPKKPKVEEVEEAAAVAGQEAIYNAEAEAATEEEETSGPKKAVAHAYLGLGLGCVRDSVNNKFCGGLDIAEGSCDFWKSCCFGEYNAATKLTPIPERLAALEKRCPGAAKAATKMC